MTPTELLNISLVEIFQTPETNSSNNQETHNLRSSNLPKPMTTEMKTWRV